MTNVNESTPPQSLWSEWAQETRNDHGLFVMDMVRKIFSNMGDPQSMENYRSYLSGLYPLYTAIENRLDELQDDEQVSLIYHPILFRQQAMEEDLGEVPEETNIDTVQELVQRVEAMEPAQIMAMAFNSQIALLVGGQRTLQRFEEAPEELGWKDYSHFYKFEGLEEPAEISSYLEEYRAKLEEAGEAFDEDQRADFMEESHQFFAAAHSVIKDLPDLAKPDEETSGSASEVSESSGSDDES